MVKIAALLIENKFLLFVPGIKMNSQQAGCSLS